MKMALKSDFYRAVPAMAVLVAGAAFASMARAVEATPPTGSASAAVMAKAHKASPMRQQKVTEKAKNYYVAAWGVDRLKVSSTASGNLIRFSYRIIEPERAKPLVDKGVTPYLLGLRSRAVLQVPVMDKVGTLRQTGTLAAGQEYWMVFSNKGNLVRPGDRVNVVIGAFHADSLMVE